MKPDESSLAVPVAIIGMGCLFPRADGLRRYWANVRDGVDAIREVPATHWDPADYHDPDPKAPDRTYARRGGFLDPVDFPALEFGIAPANLDATDTTQLLGLTVAKAALDDAGYGDGRAFDRDRVSVILGVTGTLELVIPLGARLGHPIWRRALAASGVAEPVASEVVRRIADSYVGWQENSFPGLLGNVAAGRIANRLDLGGTNCVIDAACASSLGAVHLALLELASGRCDVALTGGLDTFNDIFMYMCFSKTPALSPTGDARPFSSQGDGTILGEGLGVLTLKRLDDARRDGDRIYAVIKGVGTSSDGKGNAVYAPVAAGQAKCLRRAYEAAGVSPDTVELVEAHGTGTKVGDAVELAALAEVYRSARAEGSWCALGSVKSQIGHTKAAAGAAGLIKAALALHHKVLPPTIKVDRPADPALPGVSPFYLNTEPRPWLPKADHPRRAAVSAFGFGGSNFHCVLEEADAEPAAVAWDGDDQIVAFSGSSPDAIRSALDAWPLEPSWDDIRQVAARSRSTFRADEPCRLLIAASREGVPWGKLIDRARGLLDGQVPFASTPEGVYFGAGTEPGKLAVLFPGQGSQYVGMFRGLACRFPGMLQTLAEADAVVPGLGDRIYPHPAFDDEARERDSRALRSTDVAQPAIGAASLGAYRILDGMFGLRPDAFAGHSFGELAALHAAGRIDAPAFFELARLRGRLMAGDGGDRGGMIAAMAPIEAIEAVVGEEGLDLVVANRNAPRQAVLSGPSAEVARAGSAFEARGIKARILDVSAAFHSRLVADAGGPLREALRGVDFGSSDLPVFANSTAEPYPADAEAARSLLAEQLARPVRFVEQVEAMHDSGVRTFLEVGPDCKLTGLVGAILEGRPHSALALDASKGKRGGMADLARALAHLASLGHPIRLAAWDEGAEALAAPTRKPGLTVKVSGANFAPKPKPEPSPKPQTKTPAAPVSPRPEARPTMTDRPPIKPAPATHRPESNGKAHAANGQVLPRPVAPAPTPAPIPAGFLAESLRASQENLIALQRLGEQTAGLHRLYLEGQDRATQTFQSLLDHHHRLTMAALGLGVGEPPSAIAPTPRAIAPPAPASRPARPIALPTTPTPAVPSNRADNPGVLGVPASEPRGSASPPRSTPRPTPSPGVPKPEPLPTGARPAGSSPVPTTKTIDLAAVLAVLAEVVSEKTGYPAEVLEPAMQLDADLGIDSIKRVEILAALQDRLPGSPAIGPEHLGTIRTLGQIAEFLAGAKATAPAPGASTSAIAEVQQALIEVVSEKTGYPAEVLEPAMQLDADLGIDSIKRVEILAALQDRLPGSPAIGPEHLGTIRTLGQIAEFLAGGPTPIEEPGSAHQRGGRGNGTPLGRGAESTGKSDIGSPVGPGPATLPVRRLVPSAVRSDESTPSEPIRLRGEVWVGDDGTTLTAAIVDRLDAVGCRGRRIDPESIPEAPDRPAGLVLLGPGEGSTILDAFRLLRAAAPGLRASRGSFVTVTKLGGSFGLDGLPPGTDAASGALAGLAKTASREWPEVHCKAIDLDPTFAEDQAAAAIVEELTHRGPIEVGLSAIGRKTVALHAVAATPGRGGSPISAGDVVVVTGGARGVTADVAVALAHSSRPTIAILGRSPAPTAEPDWLAPIRDEAEIKRALHARSGGMATPQSIGEDSRKLAANREILANLRRIEEAGSKVLYRAVDVRDREAVRAVVASIRSELGPIRGLIHGAGVLADRRIEDQTDEQFARVYRTKVDGLEALLGSVGDDLKALVVFSSSTARFGRSGQVAYAAANEALNKIARREAQDRPGCRVVAANWGPWDGGMVTPSLRPLFEAEGIALIPPIEGARFLVDELAASAEGPVEVVVLGGGGPDPSFIDPIPAPAEDGTMARVFERVLDVESTPILRSHVMDGRPVLPMALILEWLAQGATTRHPGLACLGVDDLRLLKGVVLRDGRPETVRVLAGKASRRDDRTVVPVELRGATADGRDVLHARAEIVLGDRHPGADRPGIEPSLPPYSADASEVYRDVLFHGPDLRGIVEVEGCGEGGIVAQVATAPTPSAWVEKPLRNQWLTDPLAIDCAFQMMILWSVERSGAGSLPTVVGRYRQFRRSYPAGGVRVVARVTEAGSHRARADVDFVDGEGELVARIEDYECVIDASLRSAFGRNEVAPAGSK